MKTIYKYEIGSIIVLPTSAMVVKVGEQRGISYIWIELDTEEIPVYPRKYRIYGTGAEIPDSAIWQGTFFEDIYVWHVYEVMK